MFLKLVKNPTISIVGVCQRIEFIDGEIMRHTGFSHPEDHQHTVDDRVSTSYNIVGFHIGNRHPIVTVVIDGFKVLVQQVLLFVCEINRFVFERFLPSSRVFQGVHKVVVSFHFRICLSETAEQIPCQKFVFCEIL